MTRSAVSVLYLHGFASGPGSHKAQAVLKWAAAQGVAVAAPDLNGPDFSTMTVGSQVALAGTALAGLARPTVVVGSSLGGYVAALLAGEQSTLAGALLMCPAFGFVPRLLERLGPVAVAQWQARGTTAVYHHSERAEREVAYSLVEEALRWPDTPVVCVPTVVVHGIRDPDVPVEQSRRYAAARPDLVTLVEVEDDHTLHASMGLLLKQLEALLDRVAAE